MPDTNASAILLVEPDYLLRRTVVATARSLFVVDFTEASRYEKADALAQSHRYDGWILALDDEGADQALALLQRLRNGALRTASDCPVVLLGYDPDRSHAETIQTLEVQRFIQKPIKVRHILEAVARIAPLRPESKEQAA